MNRLQRRKQAQRLRLLYCVLCIAALALVIGLLVWLISGKSPAKQWMSDDPYTFAANAVLTEAEEDSYTEDNRNIYIRTPKLENEKTAAEIEGFLAEGETAFEALLAEQTEEDTALYRFILDYTAIANEKNTNLTLFYEFIRMDEAGEKTTLTHIEKHLYLGAKGEILDLDAALGENTEKKLTLMLKAEDKNLAGMLGFGLQGDALTLYFPQGTEEFSAKAIEKASLIDPDKPMVAITFDDGPGGYSKELADLFASYGGHTTFFVLGSLVPNYEEELQYVYEMGNEVGSHTYSHKNLNICSEATVQSELEKAEQAIYDAIGAYPTLVRTPYGNANKTVMRLIDGPVILWSVDSEDWKSRDTDTIIQEVLKNVEDGDIILLHEIYGFSFNATKTILKELAAEGYQFVTVSELIKYKGIEPEGKIYSADYQVK